MAHSRELTGSFVTGAVIASIILGDEVRALIKVEVIPRHEPCLLS
jgi:hypothetical protein